MSYFEQCFSSEGLELAMGATKVFCSIFDKVVDVYLLPITISFLNVLQFQLFMSVLFLQSGIDAEKVISPMNMAQLRIDRIQLVSFCEQMSISRECLAVINR